MGETMTKERPILFSSQMVRALLEGRKTQTRRVVKCPVIQCVGSDNKQKVGPMLWDLSRAWADRGFPTDEDGKLLPMEQWNLGTPEQRRNGYLHVPFAHPSEGWEKDPKRDTVQRVYPRWAAGDTLCVRESYSRCGCKGCAAAWPAKGPHSVTYKADYVGHSGLVWRPSIHMPRWACRLRLELTAVRAERVQDISEADARAESFNDREDFFRTFYDLNKRAPRTESPWVWVLSFRTQKASGHE